MACKCEEAVAKEREFWQKIVTDLMNRIQAPTTAVSQSLPESDGKALHISAFDDEALADYEANR